LDLRDLALLAILAGSVPLVLVRPWIGVLLWYWIGLMNPHRLTWSFMYDFPVAMLVGAVTLVALVLAQLMGRERQLPPYSGETVLILLIAVWFTLTTANAWMPEQAWGYWEQFMKILLFTLVTSMLVYGRKRTEWLMIVFGVSLAFYGAKGGIFTLLTGGQYHVVGPADSFIGGNTNLGLALVMTMPLILVLAQKARTGGLACLPDRPWVRLAGWGGYGAFWLTGLATVFTYSRGALLGLAAIGPFVFQRMRYKPVLIALAIIGISSLAVLVPEKLVDRAETIQSYQQDYSAMQRIQAWGVSWNIARDHVLGGGFQLVNVSDSVWLGYANFMGEWVNHARAAHSIYFQVLGHHGFVGLALYLALLGGTMLALFRLVRRARLREDTAWISGYAWALLVGMIGFAVCGAFLSMAYFTLFYAFLAGSMVLQREYASAVRQSATERDSERSYRGLPGSHGHASHKVAGRR